MSCALRRRGRLLTISLPGVLRGDQEPRLSSVPPFASSAGQEAVELAASAGLLLDPWQELVLRGALGERLDGKWSAFEVGLVVARQNGKGAILEARELAGLFLFGERLILHSAHQFDTALEAFRRILELIESTPDLDSRVKRVSRSHGEEGLELKGGQRLRFKARTKAGGRGFSGDTVILDEAMILPSSAISALMPTMSARPNPQLWYVGSAVDQVEHPDGRVFAGIRDRGMVGGDPSLAFFEWSAEEHDDPADPVTWAKANPGLGIRITAEHVAREQRSMLPKAFGVERLSIGDWPSPGGGWRVISEDLWRSLCVTDHGGSPGAFALDVAPDRSSASIGAAGLSAEGVPLVRLLENGAGTDWLVPAAVRLWERWRLPFVIDTSSSSPAATVAAPLERAGVSVHRVSTANYVIACGDFYDAADSRRLAHTDQPELNAAVAAARKRTVGDAWAWSRKDATDISPLVAVTLALHGLTSAASTGGWMVSF